MQSPPQATKNVDVLIGGAGFAGLALAIALRQALGPAFEVTVADPAVGRAPAEGTPFVLPHAARKLSPASPEIDARLRAEACNHLHKSRVKYPVGAGYTIFICRGTRMDPIN